jgi:hypothetical protein
MAAKSRPGPEPSTHSVATAPSAAATQGARAQTSEVQSKINVELMAAAIPSRAPRWYTIPVRVCLVTFVATLLCFAVALLLAILGTVVVDAVRGVHLDMRVAYRMIALPVALVAGSIIFVLAMVMEIRHYRQAKTLSAIERLG